MAAVYTAYSEPTMHCIFIVVGTLLGKTKHYAIIGLIIIIIIIIHFKDMNKPGGHMSVKNTKSEEN